MIITITYFVLLFVTNPVLHLKFAYNSDVPKQLFIHYLTWAFLCDL